MTVVKARAEMMVAKWVVIRMDIFGKGASPPDGTAKLAARMFSR